MNYTKSQVTGLIKNPAGGPTANRPLDGTLWFMVPPFTGSRDYGTQDDVAASCLTFFDIRL